jgi:hypothetical protein
LHQHFTLELIGDLRQRRAGEPRPGILDAEALGGEWRLVDAELEQEGAESIRLDSQSEGLHGDEYVPENVLAATQKRYCYSVR